MNSADRIIQRVEYAIEELKRGRLVIVTDSEEREAEGDMVGIAEFVTHQTVNTMITNARGLLCVPMDPSVAKRLGLQKMTLEEEDAFGTSFTVSTDAKNTSTGISAFDRCKTIRKLADPNSKKEDFYHPGHIFPLIARKRGVLERQGHTEAAVDLAKLAHAQPVAYITEIIKKNGEMARRKDLKSFAEGVHMTMLSISDIKMYRYMKNIDVVSSIEKVKLPTKYGNFELEVFDTGDGKEPTLLISKGNFYNENDPLIRIHSECLTGDLLGSKRCDCGEQLEASLKQIEKRGSGAVLYLRQEGRGIGLAEKIKAYHLQEQGLDTVEANLKLGHDADERNYGIAAAILWEKGINKLQIMTNNPNKIEQLRELGIAVSRRIPLEIRPNSVNKKYLKTKKNKMNHILNEVK